MASHSSTLAWKIPWAEEPGRLQSMGSLKVGHVWATSLSLFHFHALEKEMATHSSVLAWRIPWMGEPGGLPSLGSYRVGHDWSDLAAAAAYHFSRFHIYVLIHDICFSLSDLLHSVWQSPLLFWFFMIWLLSPKPFLPPHFNILFSCDCFLYFHICPFL